MEIRKQFGFTDGQKIILCVGELLPNKNQQMIIHSMKKIVKKYSDAQLLLAGNGSEKENLENLYKGIEVWSCHTYQATASIFAERGNIPYGTYDFIQRSRTIIVNPRVVGKK